jgi:hypothetical protein
MIDLILLHKIIMRDVKLNVRHVDDYDFIYFDIKDEITTTRKFINLANNLRRKYKIK